MSYPLKAKKKAIILGHRKVLLIEESPVYTMKRQSKWWITVHNV